MREQQKPQKKHPFKLLALILGMVALLGVGGKMYVDHAEKQRQEEVFVAEVGRMPHPKGENKGEPDLHITVRLNLPALTVSLLNQGADVHAKDDDGRTPLHWAAHNDASSVAGLLLKQRADVHAKDNDGETPLHKIFGFDMEVARNARAAGMPRLAAALLEERRGMTPTDAANTPLHHLTTSEDADASTAADMLLKAGADANAKNNDGFTLLHRAAQHNASTVAAVLLEWGANVNAKDSYKGWTPLHWAVSEDASSLTGMLLEWGANINAKDSYEGWTPLHVAAQHNTSGLADVLLKAGADVHAKTDFLGFTPLHIAAQHNASDVADVLLKAGADANAKGFYGSITPLHWAAKYNASDVTEILLKAGADVHAKTDNGRTPLRSAIEEENSETAAVLRLWLNKLILSP